MTPKMPDIKEPKTPIPVVKPPGGNRNSGRPMGRDSLVSTTAALRKKPAYTVKSSLLG